MKKLHNFGVFQLIWLKLCRLSILFDNAVWQCHLTMPCDNAVWQCCLTMPFDNAVWQRRLTTTFDNAVWQRHSTTPFHNGIPPCPSTMAFHNAIPQRRSTTPFYNDVWQRCLTTPFNNAIWLQSRTLTLLRFLVTTSNAIIPINFQCEHIWISTVPLGSEQNESAIPWKKWASERDKQSKTEHWRVSKQGKRC